MSSEIIKNIKESKVFSNIDLHFANFIIEQNEEWCPELYFSALFLSQGLMRGHIALEPEHIEIPEELKEIDIPEKSSWIEEIKGCSIIKNEVSPIIVEDGRLYLQRYHYYETELANLIKKKAVEKAPFSYDKHKMKELFKDDEIKIKAAQYVMKNGLTVITGGPGTGKTTVVANILHLLVSEDSGLRFALAAPTGKAAARMSEAIKNSFERCFEENDEVCKNILKHKGSTLHRLLGFERNSVEFKHNDKKRLPFDLVIVDEASMIDLPMMKKLFSALRDDARIILLGDKDQLSSVEAGSVFADICEGLTDNVFKLEKNYRFKEDSNIWKAAQSINKGQMPEEKVVRELIIDNKEIEELIHKFYKPFTEEKDPGKALALYNKFRILCATRKWSGSVKSMNDLVENVLKLKKSAEFYESRAIMITENCYPLGLFNGDTGILKNDDNGNLRAWFEVEGILTPFVPALLPAHETAFATTIHKSQGSEFDNVLIIMPEKESPILTRELLYTGITRAKEKVYMHSNKKLIEESVNKKVRRSSGLKKRF
jgi:exodeoxyribonuclease V alpha subunit